MHGDRSVTEVAARLERASRLIHSAGHAEGLYPAQWSALRYCAEAPLQERTTAALARFQGMNLGPVARTVRTLVDKGLLTRGRHPGNGRADLLSLTAAGAALLERDPRRALVSGLSGLRPDRRAALAEALDRLIEGLFREMKGTATRREDGEGAAPL
jgi:DNA-binding MarR family transcriptional regulator